MSRSRFHAFCALSMFLVTFTACGGDDGTDPDDNRLEAFIGTYTLTPAPTMTCDLGALGDATVTIDTVEVVDAGSDFLDLRVPARASGDAFPVQRFDAEFEVSADQDGDFTGGEPLEVDFSTGVGTIHGDGLVSITGQFSGDEETFGALINASFAVAFGDNDPTDCTEISALLVTGTRVD